MAEFQHQRHQPPSPLERRRELIVACAPTRSNVNLSRIARAAGCCGVRRLICCGTAKLVEKIARDADRSLDVEVHRSLRPVLEKLRAEGRPLVGLEQTTGSTCLYDYAFARDSVLVIGNERQGLSDDVLQLLDAVVEIPIYGAPLSHNVATATAMALYEYCRQYPRG